MADYVQWQDQTQPEHLASVTNYTNQGYGLISLSIYGAVGSPYYAAVMVRPAGAQQHHFAALTADEWQSTFSSEAAQGYGPVILSATGPAWNPLFAAVFEPQNPIPLTRHGLASGPGPWHVQQLNNSSGAGASVGGEFVATSGPAAVGELFVCVYNNQQHFCYRDATGNIQDAWYDGNGWNLQQINNGGMTNGPAAADQLFVCVYNDQQHFCYRDGKGNIQDAWYGTDGWHLQQINNDNGAGGTVPGEFVATNGPTAMGDLFVCVYNNQQHFCYRDAYGNIQDAWYGTDGWHLQQINNANGGGATFRGELVATDGPTAEGDLFVSVYNGQQHFCYRDRTGTIQDAWYDGNGWQFQQINNGGMTGGPPAAGDLFVSVYHNQQHFCYRDRSGNLQDAWYGTDGWHLQQINNANSAGPTIPNEFVATSGPQAARGLFICVYNDQQHFCYGDGKGNVHDAWYGADGWHVQQINNATGKGPILTGEFIATNGPMAVGDPFVCDYNGQQHFSYLDGNGNIQDCWYDGGPDTFQQIDAQAKLQGLILHWAAAYGDSNEPRFAAIWAPNPGRTMWSAEGVSDSAGDYQARFDAQTSQWCRPAFVTLNSSLQYLSLFVDSEVDGGWYARHGLSSDGYRSEVTAAKDKGLFPVCVQAAAPLNSTSGLFPPSATFAAIFAKSRSTIQKVPTPIGPVTNTAIDNLIFQAMQNGGPVRHAALAIVRGTQLVYARGYTVAEPDWPIAQPTTCFRLASVSKTITALAIYQLMEEGRLKFNGLDRVQDILNLTAPGGGPPTDPYFQNLTIQNLLEHKNGLDTVDFSNAVAVRDAFAKAGHPLPTNPQTGSVLPVSAESTDLYVAGSTLNPATIPPKNGQLYSNCGYYLLGRVVAKLRNIVRPIDAYQQYVFDRLGITRIRRARTLVTDQAADEGRYQDPNLILAQSQMSDSQPLVPDQYGSSQLEIFEGAGGLSGAVTDVARLVAILMSPKDNAIMQRTTLNQMLQAGAALTGSNLPFSGYGFDKVFQGPTTTAPINTQLGSGQYYGQKGGSLNFESALNSTQSVLQFDGNWGFVLLWGSDASALPPPSNKWYPDYPALMNIATSVPWGSGDLFPQFGMPSL